MRFRLLYPSGLKANALLISVSLIALTVMLGVRANTVARVHIEGSKALLERDIPLQQMLFQLDAAFTAKQQAQKKWEITEDVAYGELFAKYGVLEARIIREVTEVWPGFDIIAKEAANGGLTEAHIQRAQEMLISEKAAALRDAREVAAGLLRVMTVALVLSIVITAWLILLLYQGLLHPLRRLRDATARIRDGELACRMKENGVSELKEIAQDFNSMAARLETLDQAKNDFLATISHEIRNPMTALKEGLSLLASEEKKLSAESQKKCLSACLIASKRLEFMINNLLNLSRTESGILERDFSRRNIAAAIQTAIDEIRPIAERKSISVRLLAPELVFMSFHWEGIVQAFVNLLLNAIKYGRESSIVDVMITNEVPSPNVEIEVMNAGADIPHDELPKIFDRFYRGANSLKQQGMGVGLHVVKKVVEAHQGAVSALSGSGHTRIRISLPKTQRLSGAASFVGGGHG